VRRPSLFYIRVAAALLFVAFNSTAQKVTTTRDNAFDFKNAKRYA
jgi:hypothetical protein